MTDYIAVVYLFAVVLICFDFKWLVKIITDMFSNDNKNINVTEKQYHFHILFSTKPTSIKLFVVNIFWTEIFLCCKVNILQSYV